VALLGRTNATHHHYRKDNPMDKKDHELFIFSAAMQILVKASALKYQPFSRNHNHQSIGMEGFGTISTLGELAAALNVKGYRTSRGKYLTAINLKKMKSIIIKRYGHDFVADLVEWKDVSQFPLDDVLMEKETKKEITQMNAVDYKPKYRFQKSYYEWWLGKYMIDPETDQIVDKEVDKEFANRMDKALGIAA
jgi:hypothetical protein